MLQVLSTFQRRVPLEFTLTYAAADQRYSITGNVTIDYWQEARG